jgi:GntR family transcriptional regulator
MSGPAVVELSGMAALEISSFVPLYAQIAERFAAAIRRSHASLVGAPLPSEAACTDYFKVSRPTVRQAMSQLLTQGLIVRGRGRGTFVAPQRINHDLSHAFEDEMRVSQREVSFRLLERGPVPADDKVRQALQLPADREVERFVRLRIVEDEIFGYEERYVAAEHAARISDAALGRKAIVSLIQDFAGETPKNFALTIRSIRANKTQAKLLTLQRGAPLLSSEHRYFLASGVPVLYGLVLFHGERYQFSVETTIRPI